MPKSHIPRAARYIRVSRHDQDPALQRDETARLVDGRGWSLVETYEDRGESGGSDARPAFRRLMNDARRGRFGVLIVWRSDRLFRSLKNLVTTLDELAAIGIDFVSVTEQFDTTTPQGKLLLQVVAAFAEFERNILIERTKAGMEAARRRGSRIGRPPVAIDVEQARSLRATGKSIRQIAKDLGLSPSVVHRALSHDGSDSAASGSR